MELSEQELQMLWTDKSFGILTRPAIEITFNRRSKNRRSHNYFDWVVFIDLDNIHNINAANAVNGQDGYAATDALIRQAFSNVIRKDDHFTFVNAGRHQSGDEVVFYINGNPKIFCNRLQESLKSVGLSATMAYSKPEATYQDTVNICAAKVHAAKNSNQRGTIRR